MRQLKPVNVRNSARLFAIILGYFGIFAGILYAVGGAIYDLSTTGLTFGTVLAFMAIIGMPILFALVGLVLGSCGAIFYNVIVLFLKD